MRILYVDDEADIREVAELSLSLNPAWQIKTAASGAEALSVLDAWAPDVVLLDVMMPMMDGPQTLEAIRQRRSAEDLPVIFITARVLATDRNRLMGLGAAGVIAKPFDPMKLAPDVAAIVSEHGRV
ncbi:MAG: response regulator [Caulobacteraceae bacterium]